ncbi:MAG: Gfo/Idh/MocA family oxidoreductase [Kiritimatiellaeota bacterium]|nr:Gfo/Idh/MocA family oxidoreductase [Kiritimatiellota bacterium]
MNAPRTLIVGAGGITNAWIPHLKTEGFDIVGIVDLRVEAAKAKAAEHGLACAISSNLAYALRREKPEVVVDLTIPDSHCKVTCAALRAGCHVIGEKPMAASMSQARKMVRVAEAAGRLYMVSQSRRYDARHCGIKAELASGRVGALTTVNCDFFLGCHFGGFRDEMDSPLILDMSIHHFDLARMMTGASPVAVYAKEFNPAGSWYKGDVSANCIFEMSDGIVFSYRGSWCAEGMHTSWHGDWRFIGQKGTLCYERDQTPRGEVVANNEGFNRTLSSFEVADLPCPGGQHGAIKELKAFLETGAKPQGECHDNIQSLAMVFGAIESSRKGKRVEIKV